MAKKTQGTDTKRHDIAVPPENRQLDKSIARYIIRALLLMILFAWALMNLDAVMKFLGKVISLFSPFLIGGGIAFLINVVLNPLERCWNRVCKKAPVKLARPVCLTLSAVLVFGILFAVVFMMIPSLRESGGEFIQNIPIYVDEIGGWWADTVHFAAKYNIVLPEYAIDSDLLIEKITAFINDEGSGIITVTWGAATSILSGLVDVLLAFVFALYLLAKKEVVAAHLKKTDHNGASTNGGKAASEHRFADESNLYQLCQRTAYRGRHYWSPLLPWNADSEDPLCRCRFRICCRYRVGADLRRMARRRSWHISDSVGRTHQSGVVHCLSADSTTGRGQSDLSKSCWKIGGPARTACADGCHDWRRGVWCLGNAFQRSGLCGAI